MGREASVFDVVLKRFAFEFVGGEARAEASEKERIDVSVGELVRAKNFWIEKIEHLAGASSRDGDAASVRERRRFDQLGRKFGGSLGLADVGHVKLVVIGGDDFGPGAAEVGIHVSDLKLDAVVVDWMVGGEFGEAAEGVGELDLARGVAVR